MLFRSLRSLVAKAGKHVAVLVERGAPRALLAQLDQRGNQIVKVNVGIPKSLSKKEKELVQAQDKEKVRLDRLHLCTQPCGVRQHRRERRHHAVCGAARWEHAGQ